MAGRALRFTGVMAAVGWILAGIPSAAVAADSTTGLAAIEALRTAYLKERAGAAVPRLQAYREALVRLERSAVGQRDYRTAIRIRDERRTVEKQLADWTAPAHGAPPAPSYPGGPISLAARDARTSGGVQYDEGPDALAGWKSQTARAQWTLPFPLKAGGYDVVVEMACAPGSGGQLTIREDFHSLTKKISPTGGWNDFASQTLGTLRIKANSTGLHLTALTVEGDGLFLLRCVKLVPVAPDVQ